VRVLATSREPLQTAGEARFRLGPLALPGHSDPAGGSEAVTLFADRVRQADARFALTGETGPVVARLDGMPLAIELAAARVEALGWRSSRAGSMTGSGLLAGGDRLAPGRHRSVAVEWSYPAAGRDERRVFRQLSVFPGSFTLVARLSGAG
jgi:predicted ATPase